MPEISVVIPVYNVENYLEESVKSILNQTFLDFEILLIDDGSTDKSGTICDELATSDSRIRVFHKKNGGVSSARNVGLDNALGTFVAFCDPDDFIHPQMFEILHQCAINNNSEGIVCNFEYFSNINDIKIKNIELEHKYSSLNGKQAYEYICLPENSNMLGCVWNKLYLKSSIGELRFDTSLSYGEDLCFVLTFLSTTKSIIVLDDIVLYYYFVRQDSAMRTLDSKKYLKLYYALLKTYEVAEQNMGLEVNSYFGRVRILVDTFLNVQDEDFVKMRTFARRHFFKVIFAKNIGWKEKLIFIKKLIIGK